MAIAVYVEQVSDDEFIIFENGDEPGKSVNDHCALIQRTVRPGWRNILKAGGFPEWLESQGMTVHPDSDYSPVPYGAFGDDMESLDY